MDRNVALAQASMEEAVLPQRVQEALGELVGSAREGLLALSVGVGLGVLAELLEEEVEEVVGAKGKHNPDRAAARHGHESGEVTLGGRRVAVERPRVRSADGRAEVRLQTYEHFADRDPLSRLVLERMLAGARIATRRDARQHPLHNHPRERVPRGEVLVGLQPDLLAAVGAAYPRPLDVNAPPAEGDLARLVAVTHRAALRVVSALRADNLVDLLFQQLGQHAEPDAHTQRE